MILLPFRKNYPFYVLIIPIIIMIVSFSPDNSFADAEKIFKENNRAIVVIVAFDEGGNPISQGSGFVVRQDGAIVTSYHVISKAEDIDVRVGNKVLKVEGLLHMDKENDIVMLKAKGENLQNVRIGDIGKVNVGEGVYVISSPKGLENTISEGILSGIREIDPERKILQITAPFSEGSSGGAVFNKDGEVIGVATFLIEDAQNLNFAIPVNLIKDKIAGKKVTALKDAEIGDYKKTAEYWFFLGSTYYLSDMYKEAIEAYKQILRIKPYYTEAYRGLGFAYRKLKMYRDSMEAFKQVIRIDPDDKLIHFSLGVTYGLLGMHKEAMEAFKQAIRINRYDAVAHHALGNAYHYLGKYGEAIVAYKQAISFAPDFAVAYSDLGEVYNDLGMHKEAMEAFGQAIRINPDLAEAHYNIGLLYLIFNGRESAFDEYKILKDLNPELANKLFNSIYK